MTPFQREAIDQILSDVRTKDVKDGSAVDWGTPGNKARAIYQAGLMGVHFEPNCKSCDSDLYFTLKFAKG